MLQSTEKAEKGRRGGLKSSRYAIAGVFIFSEIIITR